MIDEELTEKEKRQIKSPVRIQEDSATSIMRYAKKNELDFPAAVNQVLRYGMKHMEIKDAEKKTHRRAS